jgi:cytochrome c-type biogenesis protein CcmH/NrfG
VSRKPIFAAVALALIAPVTACKRERPPVPSQPAQAPQGAPSRISQLESTVAREPQNRAAWVQLGNLYFDTHQPQKAVDAYGKALELQGDDPNVLTDRGVMYRELGDYDEAIRHFERALQADPNHLQSRFNLGVVWAADKKDAKKGIAIWKEVADRDPTGPHGTQARANIQKFQAQLGAGGGGPAPAVPKP